MIIRLLAKSQSVADFSLSGAVVTVRGLAVDCTAHYNEGDSLVEIRMDTLGNAVLGGDGPLLAVIKIPAQRFSDDSTLLPLEPNAVIVNLWPCA